MIIGNYLTELPPEIGKLENLEINFCLVMILIHCHLRFGIYSILKL